jgi:cation diffusion facilitator CzcD-associated flavoprotein CzcO
MQQRTISVAEQTQLKAFYATLFASGRDSAAGFPAPRPTRSFWQVSAQERERLWEDLWQRGAFSFMISNFRDIVMDLEANKLAYEFWRKKVHERMRDKKKAELMAPKEAPYPFGTKRSPLEADYYEMLDRDNVDIVQLTETPLERFNTTGVRMKDGTQHDFDVVILATGFDAFSGSLTRMGLISKDGVDIADIWRSSISTYLGLTITGFPNAFMVYSPHAPTAFSNGPTILECQVDWCVECIRRMEEQGARSIEATKEAEEAWVRLVEKMGEKTLFPLTNSWWTGMNTETGERRGKMLSEFSFLNFSRRCDASVQAWQRMA